MYRGVSLRSITHKAEEAQHDVEVCEIDTLICIDISCTQALTTKTAQKQIEIAEIDRMVSIEVSRTWGLTTDIFTRSVIATRKWIVVAGSWRCASG